MLRRVWAPVAVRMVVFGGVRGLLAVVLHAKRREDFVTLESVWRRVAAHRSRNLNPHLPYEISSASS